MTNTYLNQLINEFDQEFESLVIPFPESYVVNNVEVSSEVNSEVNSVSNNNQVVKNDNELAEKLNKIKSLAVEISAERYSPNYNPEICLANLLNYILSADDQDLKNDFFQLLDQDHNLNLDQALTDFDFYMNNPYKKKAEKILSKIEARKNK
jgi:hypothetical protein